MKYAILIYEDAKAMDQRDAPGPSAYWDEWFAYSRAMTEAGKSGGGGACLAGPGTGTTLRQGAVEDGPFADTKEQLGGFMLIEADTLDEAMDWARRCPAAAYGAVEVRPVHDVSAHASTTEEA